MQERIILVLVVMFCAGATAALWDLDRLSSKLIESTAVEDSARQVEYLEELRALYASEVIERLHGQGSPLRMTTRHTKEPFRCLSP